MTNTKDNIHGAKPVQSTRGQVSGRGPGALLCGMFVSLGTVIISVLYQLTLSHQAPVSLQLTVCFSHLL